MGDLLRAVEADPRAALDVLGTPRLSLAGRSLPVTARNGTLRLAAALALWPLVTGRPATRTELARALWPDASPNDALANVRRHLSYFESAFRRAGLRSPVQRDETTLSLDETLIRVDLWMFVRAVDDDTRLEEATDWYAGDFLEGDDAEWIAPYRATFEQRFVHAVERLLALARSAGDRDAVARWRAAILARDPFREDVVRDELRDRARRGDRAGVLEAYRSYAAALHAEFAAEPSAEVRNLVERLAADSVPSSIDPNGSTRFFGREAELALLGTLLGTHRAITLTGAPGVGKTRLAYRAADLYAGRFVDGIVVLDLTGLDIGDSVFEAIERAVPAGLATSETLIVLDNCEHVLAQAAAAVDRTLRATGESVRILSTSRLPLDVPGEATLRVEPLGVPHPSVDLFLDRARSARPDAAFDRNIAEISDLCTRLDGLPLALELAAARLRTMSLDDVCARLDDRFGLLRRDAGDRHGALGAAFDESYRTLRAEDRILFRTLALFAGPWTIEAAIAACGQSEWAVIDGLRRLVDASLVSAPPGNAHARRYTMLQSLKEYARARDEPAPRTATRERIARFYASRLAERSDELNDETALAVFDEIEADLPNIRLALDITIDEGVDPGLGARCCVALLRFWYVRGHVVEAGRRLATILGAAALPAATRLSVLVAYAVVSRNRNDYRRAHELFEEAHRQAAGEGDVLRAATLAVHVADCTRTLGNWERARDLAIAALPQLEAGDVYVAGYAYCELGLIAVDCGELERALDLFARADALFEQTDSTIDRIVVDANRTTALVKLGRLEEALNVGTSALRRSRAHQVRFVEASVLVSLAAAHALARAGRAAKDHLALALAIARELDDDERLAEICEVAAAVVAEEEPAGAARLLGSAGGIRKRCGALGGRLVAAERDQLGARLRERLGAARIEAAMTHGQTEQHTVLVANLYRLLR
jgi:predicted ATPase/DNA-binding SARP family transcriptional activator